MSTKNGHARAGDLASPSLLRMPLDTVPMDFVGTPYAGFTAQAIRNPRHSIFEDLQALELRAQAAQAAQVAHQDAVQAAAAANAPPPLPDPQAPRFALGEYRAVVLEVIAEWDFVDRHGAPIPCTDEGARALPGDLLLLLLTRWSQAVSAPITKSG